METQILSNQEDALKALEKLLEGELFNIQFDGWPIIDICIHSEQKTGFYVSELVGLSRFEKELGNQIDKLLSFSNLKYKNRENIYFEVSNGSTKIKASAARSFDKGIKTKDKFTLEVKTPTYAFLITMIIAGLSLDGYFEFDYLKQKEITKRVVEKEQTKRIIEALRLSKDIKPEHINSAFSYPYYSFENFLSHVRDKTDVTINNVRYDQNYIKKIKEKNKGKKNQKNQIELEGNFTIIKTSPISKYGDMLITLLDQSGKEIKASFFINNYSKKIHGLITSANNSSQEVWIKLRQLKIDDKEKDTEIIDIFEDGFLQGFKK